MGFARTFLTAATLCATTVYSQIAVHQPANANKIQYSVSIPESTQSSGNGDLFMQLSAPTTYQWIGLGIGKQMAGAKVFVMYQDGKGNVTVSPRNAIGEFMPLYNPQASITLLEGSGVSNGLMVANVRYTVNSSVLSNPTDTQSPWICSWKTGDPLNSANPSVILQQHDDHDQFTYNLQAATIQNDANPFVSSSGQAAASSGHATVAPTPVPSRPATSSAGDRGSSFGEEFGSQIVTYQKAHGSIMGVALVLLLPFGAIAMRLGINVWIHAGIQILAVGLIVVGFGLGVHMAQNLHILYKNPHTIIGTIVFVAILLQPFMGLAHHLQFKRLGHRSYFGFLHIWYGRTIILLGIINGGLGLWLAANSKNGEIAYGVVAGVIGLLWLAVILLTMFRRGRRNSNASENRRLARREGASRESKN